MYLDSAAGAKTLDRDALRRISELLQLPLGNPSSPHREGRLARRILREAREEVAAALGAVADEVVFTAGLSEALFLGVRGLGVGRSRIFVSEYEHPSMYAAIASVADASVSRFALDAIGRPLADFSHAGLVCVSTVNHETGMCLDLQATIDAAGDALLLLDAAQGGAPEAWRASPRVTALALSSQKLGGPPGVGALLVRKGAPFVATVRGGAQEHELRAGTEAVVAIAGFARALSGTVARASAESAARRAAQAAFEDSLQRSLVGVHVVAGDRRRAPGISLMRVTGVPARALCAALDARGIYISAGAACASQRQEPSNVTRALGLSRERGLEVFRVSFPSDADAAVGVFAAEAVAAAARSLRGESHAPRA